MAHTLDCCVHVKLRVFRLQSLAWSVGSNPNPTMSREVGWKLVAWGLSEDVPRSLWGVWVYIYICVCVCMYVCTYVCMCIYICMYVYIYIYEREQPLGSI